MTTTKNDQVKLGPANEAVEFEINLTGESTGEKWWGKFKAKRRLSHRDQLRKDQIRRELLGDTHPDNASVRAFNQAEVFAQLAVRLVEVPKWWAAAGGGLDLYDDNVVAQVYEKSMKIENDTLQAIVKEGQSAEEELRKEVKDSV